MKTAEEKLEELRIKQNARVAAYKKRQAEKGLAKVEVYVKIENVALIKEFAEELRK